jgi:hypothetical protein
MVLMIKYGIQKCKIMVLGEMFQDVIASDAVSFVRRIWTGMGEIDDIH